MGCKKTEIKVDQRHLKREALGVRSYHFTPHALRR